jgi:hypothetical protein
MTKREPSAWGYNWATLFLGNINTRIWSVRLGSLKSETINYGHDPRITALAKASSNCKQQTCPLIREGTQHQQTHNYLTVTKIWSLAPNVGLTPWQIGQLTASCSITLNWVNHHQEELQESHQPVKTWVQKLRYLYCWEPFPGNNQWRLQQTETVRAIVIF